MTQAAVNVTSSKISVLIYKMNTGISTVKHVCVGYLQQQNRRWLDGWQVCHDNVCTLVVAQSSRKERKEVTCMKHLPEGVVFSQVIT